MATFEHELAEPPPAGRGRELWLQHAAGFLLFRDVREYAMRRIDPALSSEARDAAQKGLDDAMYGLMMVLDGVSGAVENATLRVELCVTARLVQRARTPSSEIVAEVTLRDGDGMCMGYHGWLEGDFGEHPIVMPTPIRK